MTLQQWQEILAQCNGDFFFARKAVFDRGFFPGMSWELFKRRFHDILKGLAN